MRSSIRFGRALAALLLPLVAVTGVADATQLFNGKNLDGWTFHLLDDEQQQVEDPWIVERGLLICRGVTKGYLIHKEEFENYVLTLEVRTMSTEEGNGTAIGSLGRIFINAVAEEGAFSEPKSIAISLRDSGDVYFRDIDQETMRDTNAWVKRAPDRAEDVERDMGKWNRLKVICNEKRLTVVINGTTVNQIDPINRTRGAVALMSQRGFFPAPTFYRNIGIRPIAAADLKEETKAASQFARIQAAIAQPKAVEDARQAEADRLQSAAKQALAKEWANAQVAEDVEFITDARRLPVPANAQEIQFQFVIGRLEFESRSSLAALSSFYKTEMAQRGWRVTETDIEDDEVTVTFQHGKAAVELNLDESSDGVDVRLDCDGLSFDGTNDPAGLVKMGVPQPEAYLVLQREFRLPDACLDETYDMDQRRLFKSTLTLTELYTLLTQQLLQNGYRETRRPIISKKRRYSEFAKGGIEISVNAFKHKIGSRVVLSYEKD